MAIRTSDLEWRPTTGQVRAVAGPTLGVACLLAIATSFSFAGEAAAPGGPRYGLGLTALYLIGGFPLLVWGFFVSTVLLYHGTFLVNSLCHVLGTRRYQTTDQSRNNWLVAILTLGEGWHNNHHHYQSAACQGFFWWEIDLSYYALKGLEVFGVVWDVRRPPKRLLQQQPK